MRLTERDLLKEIANIIAHSDVSGSANRNTRIHKFFFDPLDLPKKLESYVKESRRESVSSAAKMFRMSPTTLRNLINGGPLSENILFRLRNSLEYALQHPGISVLHDDGDTYFGDWRNTSSTKLQDAITVVADRLLFLKRAIESSNRLNSSDTPIDEIQIAQLVALLEATLAAIKAPLVDTGQAKGFFRWLAKISKRAVEKKVETEIVDAIDDAVRAGSDLLDQLANSQSTSDLGNMIT